MHLTCDSSSGSLLLLQLLLSLESVIRNSHCILKRLAAQKVKLVTSGHVNPWRKLILMFGLRFILRKHRLPLRTVLPTSAAQPAFPLRVKFSPQWKQATGMGPGPPATQGTAASLQTSVKFEPVG